MTERRNTCANCAAFYGTDLQTYDGVCRRKAPTVNGFPFVRRDEWCLEHVALPQPVSSYVQRPKS